MTNRQKHVAISILTWGALFALAVGDWMGG